MNKTTRINATDKAAFWLAIFVLVWPIQADFLCPFFGSASTLPLATGFVLKMTFSLMVLVPFILARLKARKEPERWQNRNGYAIATGGILILDALAYGWVFGTALMGPR